MVLNKRKTYSKSILHSSLAAKGPRENREYRSGTWNKNGTGSQDLSSEASLAMNERICRADTHYYPIQYPIHHCSEPWPQSKSQLQIILLLSLDSCRAGLSSQRHQLKGQNAMLERECMANAHFIPTRTCNKG